MRRYAAILIVICGLLAPLISFAQSDDDGPGYLAGLLEDALSGAGREVRIRGFKGAVSRQATIASLVIADDQGTWFEAENIALDWRRAALLRGVVDVTLFRAETVTLSRAPASEPAEGLEAGGNFDLPSAEATPFRLPDLPVAVQIEQFEIGQVNVGAPLLGEAAAFALSGAAELAGGGADLRFALDRVDGPEAQIALAARYDPETRRLAVDLMAEEAADGLVSRVLGIPGAPALALTAQGDGPVDAFAADIALASGGTPRLAGRVEIAAPQESGAWELLVDLSGDPTPLLRGEAPAFFGDAVDLQAHVLRAPTGAVSLPVFRVATQALTLTGRATLSPTGWVETLEAQGEIANPAGGPVMLPFGGGRTQVESLRFDATVGQDALRFDARVAGWDSPEAHIGAVTISGRGQSDPQRAAGQGGDLSLDLRFVTETLALTEPALAEAVGPALRGVARVAYGTGKPVQISGIEIGGAGYGLTGSAEWRFARQADQGMPLGVDLRVQADALDQFAALAGRDLAGQASLSLLGQADPISGMFDLTLAGETQDVSVGEGVADGLLAGAGRVEIDARRDETGTVLRQAQVTTPALEARASGRASQARTELHFDGALRNLEQAFPGEGSGAASLRGRVELTGARLRRLSLTADVGGDAEAASDGAPTTAAETPLRLPVAGGIEVGQGRVVLEATETEGPTQTTQTAQPTQTVQSSEATEATGTTGTTGNVAGTEGATEFAGQWRAEVDLARLDLPQVSAERIELRGGGPLRQGSSGDLLSAGGDLRLVGSGLALSDDRLAQAIGTGPALTAELSWDGHRDVLTVPSFALATDGIETRGSATLRQVSRVLDARDVTVALTVLAERLEPLSGLVGQRLRGAAQVDLEGRYAEGGAFGLSLRGTGRGLSLGAARVDPLLAGDSRFAIEVSGAEGALDQISADVQTRGVTAQVSGPLSALQINARLADIGVIAPDFQGALVLAGTVGQQGDGYVVDVDLDGPGGTALRVDGGIDAATRADISVTGAVPLGLANVFIAPRRLNGRADLALRLSGPFAVSSLSGTITPQAAEFSAPTLGVILAPITGQIRLVNGVAQVNVTAQGNQGGTVAVDGRLGLAGLEAGLTARLDRFGVRDPDLYSTALDGAVTLTGPIGRDLLIAGNLALAKTEIQVPASGVSALGEIPPVTHLGATRPVMRTLERADAPSGPETPADASRRPASTRVDLTLRAPGQVFVRGRGLDAELAGQLRLTGPSSDLRPEGGFTLQRGRLDILNQRFTLDEGRIQLSGRFDPVLRFVAATEANGIIVRVILGGRASAPEISFSSSPELPEDEVLAQLLFGRNLSNLSALQALELANAVATLAGRGGGGVLSRLRDGFGLDDLDVTQSDGGGTAVRAGAYIADNIYSDVVVDSAGRAEITLNLDVTPDITARGRVDTSGSSSLGVFFERDY